MRIFAVFLILIAVGCGIYAEPDMILAGPIIGTEVGGRVILYGSAKNVGTQTAENCILIIKVLRLDTKAEIESHGTFLGDVMPGDEVKFEFKLFYVTFGDSIEYRTEFEWD